MSIAATVHERVHRSLVFDRRRARLAAALLEALPRESTILDIGCGNGEIGSDLAAAGHQVMGVETLERASCAIPMSLYDGDHLPFADDSFDWVTIVDVLHHAADPVRVVSEAARVSRGGIVVKDHCNESVRQRVTLSFMDWVGNRQFGVGRDGRYLSRAEWREVWAATGLVETAGTEELDLYPRVVKPLFENGLHFVARLEPAGPSAP
ncbi:MAG: class I SAM-dependent methyltransferase [Ilumatobacter sp.]|uniref:class I SAM-dependent methyltransferase n=1 Tax=Ilumatobacter sp. TaxID=1967498 RepID=UPI00391D7DDE